MLNFITSVVVLAFTSCTQLINDTFGATPVQYVSAQIVIGDDGTCQHLVGMHYTLANATDTDISGVHVSFLLYDTSGNAVPQGKNYFDVTFTGKIPAKGETTVCSSLDSQFYLG